MINLETRYLGLKLKNPIILSSCGLTSTLEKVKAAEKAGVGAVVLKSIFEEQILSEVASVDKYSDYPEVSDYLKGYLIQNTLGLYLKLIQDCKRECSIPIIASINCADAGEWINFARVVENAGADAIELNIFKLPTDKDEESEDIEKKYLDIVASVRDAITIPLAVKMARRFTNPLGIIRDLYYRNISGVVLFNRFYSPDIDIEKMKMFSSGVYSSPAELSNVIRWTGLASSKVPLIDIAASSGVYTGADAIKAMLAGAKAVQICSTVYANGLGVVAEILNDIEQWAARHDYEHTADFIGKLNYNSVQEPMAYERTQFMRYFSNHE